MNTNVHTNEEKWEVAAKIVDKLRCISSFQKTISRDLMAALADCFPRNFPINGTLLSVIYKSHIKATEYKVVTLRGQPQTSSLTLEKSPFLVIENTIIQVINGNVNYIIETSADDELSKLLECVGLIIIPIRADREKIIGAIILESTISDQVFIQNDLMVLEHITSQLEIFIRFSYQSQRSYIAHHLLTELQKNITFTNKDSDILRLAVNHLVGKIKAPECSSEPWFAKEELSVILFHSFYKEKIYYLCKEDGRVDTSFRDKDIIQKNELNTLLGGNVEKWLDIKSPVILNSSDEVTSSGLPSGYHAYAIVPMLTLDESIGLFVFRNRMVGKAYEDEEILLERIANFTAISLHNLRDIRLVKERRDFRNAFIRERLDVEDEMHMYDECCNIIKSNLGKVDFIVISRDKNLDELKVKYKTVREVELNDELKSDIEEYKNKMDNVIDESLDLTALKVKSRFDENITDAPLTSSKRFSIFSTRAESGRIINIILIGSDHVLNKNTTAFLKELFSIVSFKLSLDRKKDRLKALAEFATETTIIELPTIEKLGELVYKYTNKIMSIPTMYWALLNADDEISFPIFYKRDEHGNPFKQSLLSRKLNRKDNSMQPRTEWILLNKDPILIKTKKESVKWYEDHGGNEKIGDPFASWLGVPIFKKNQAIGVIVVYHSTIEYLYADSDRLILENIASHISSLLTQKELKEAFADNTELKEANLKLEVMSQELAQKEEETARRITMRRVENIFGERLGDIRSLIDSSLDDLSSTLSRRNIPGLDFTSEMLKQALEYTGLLIDSVRKMKSQHYSNANNINIYTLFQEALGDEYLEDMDDVKELLSLNDRTEPESKAKLLVYIDGNILLSVFHLVLEEFFKVSKEVGKAHHFSYSFILEENKIILLFVLGNADYRFRALSNSINFNRASQILKRRDNGQINTQINGEEILIEIAINKQPSAGQYYLLIENIAYRKDIFKVLEANNFEGVIIESISDIDRNIASNSAYRIIIDSKNTSELESILALTPLPEKVILLTSYASEKIEIILGKTMFLEKDKLKDPEYILSKIA